MIKAVIFDMDGLLIDSEPLWVAAETKIFSSLDVDYTPELIAAGAGIREDEVVQYVYSRAPWNGPTIESVTNDIIAEAIAQIREHGQAKPGIKHIMEIARAADLPMAIASSAPLAAIECVLDLLEIRDQIAIVHSAEHEPYGKPHPAVYLAAAAKFEVDPTDCLAFEDSVNGVISAKAAKMKCVAVPAAEQFNDPRFGVADLKLGSLAEFKSSMLSELGA